MKKIIIAAVAALTISTPALATNLYVGNKLSDEYFALQAAMSAYGGENAVVRTDRLAAEVLELLNTNQIYTARWWKIQEVGQKEGWWDEMQAEVIDKWNGNADFVSVFISTFATPADDADITFDEVPHHNNWANSTNHEDVNASYSVSTVDGGYKAEVTTNLFYIDMEESTDIAIEAWTDSATATSAKEALETAIEKRFAGAITQAVEEAFESGFDEGYAVGFKDGWKAAEEYHGIN